MDVCDVTARTNEMNNAPVSVRLPARLADAGSLDNHPVLTLLPVKLAVEATASPQRAHRYGTAKKM
jgi:hypothetical protein